MPALEDHQSTSSVDVEDELRFPPVTREHILHCSYDYWFPRYRLSCIRSRIIPLTPTFVSYLREDGIFLADDDQDGASRDEDDDWTPRHTSRDYPPPGLTLENDESDEDDDDGDESAGRRPPPNMRFPQLHQAIRMAIEELGGAVAPKLNWSSPKDATWISRHANTVKCTSPNDVYLLLKSSSFVSHDLDYAFDSTTAGLGAPTVSPSLPFQPVLVLRSFFSLMPSLEFRCFVKDRTLVAITARDLNYYSFLDALKPAIAQRAQELFLGRGASTGLGGRGRGGAGIAGPGLRLTFPEACFVFDVYIPQADYDDDDDDDEAYGLNRRRDSAKPLRLGRARLIDINPWAPRTDTLLFDWSELLDIKVPRPLLGSAATLGDGMLSHSSEADTELDTETETEAETEDEDEDEFEPEVRIVEFDDPAAYNFSSPHYSAHKLPKEVVDAGAAGEGAMRDFARRWQRMMTGGAS